MDELLYVGGHIITPIVLIVALYGIFVYVIFEILDRASVHGRLRRAAKRATRRTVQEAPNGEPVTIVGTVRYLDSPLTAPVSGRACCYYQTCLSSEINGVNEECAREFIVEDDTGSALVLAQSDGLIFEGPLPEVHDATPERVQAVLDRHGVKGTPADFTPMEWCLAEGDPIAVFGISHWEPDSDMAALLNSGGYRSRPPRITIRAPPGLSVLARLVRK